MLRRTPVETDVEEGRWTLDPVPRQASVTRRAATAWLAERGQPTEDVAIVLGELLANAVEHARTSVRAPARADASEQLVVEVRDDGPGLTAVPAQRASEDAEHGRGLHIVRALSTSLDVRRTGTGSVVRAVLPVVRCLAAAA